MPGIAEGPGPRKAVPVVAWGAAPGGRHADRGGTTLAGSGLVVVPPAAAPLRDLGRRHGAGGRRLAPAASAATGPSDLPSPSRRSPPRHRWRRRRRSPRVGHGGRGTGYGDVRRWRDLVGTSRSGAVVSESVETSVAASVARRLPVRRRCHRWSRADGFEVPGEGRAEGGTGVVRGGGPATGRRRSDEAGRGWAGRELIRRSRCCPGEGRLLQGQGCAHPMPRPASRRRGLGRDDPADGHDVLVLLEQFADADLSPGRGAWIIWLSPR